VSKKGQGIVGDQDELRLLRERVAQLEQRSAQLEASEERLQILFEHAPDGYYLSDLKGTLVDGNAAAEWITGYKREELIGKTFLKLKLLSARDLPKAASLLARNALGQSTGPDEFTLTRKDRAAITVEISTRPVTVGDRRVVLGIVRDITERKWAERQIRERTRELQTLYSLAGIAEREDITLDELYQELANTLPNGWQYPESVCARIRIEDREFRTSNFAESPWRQSAPVKVDGVVIGALDVNYLDERPDEDEGPFLKGERLLLDALAERLGRITERRKAQQLLRESEGRASLVLRATSDGIFDVDLRAGATHYSSRYAEMLGYGPTELVLSPQTGTWETLLHPDDKERTLRTLDQCLSGEIEEYRVEFRLRTKAGDWCWIESRARVAERDLAGNPLRLVGAHTDISERKRGEEALRESEERFRTLYESAPIGLYRTAPDGSILMANAALVKMLGFSSQDALLERNLEVEGFELAHSRSQFLERVEKEETITGLESVWTRQDGTTVVVRENSRATRDSDGKTLFYDGVVTDITERKKAEEALRESEDRYRGLVSNIPGVIFTMDLGGKITFVSQRIRDLLGYESAEVVGRSVLDLIPDEERQRAADGIQSGMKGEGIKHFETPMIRKSGERLFLECSFARVRRDGAVVGAQGTAVDITERKRMEEALRESERNARHRAEGLRLVGEVGAAIAARLDLERLMQTLCEQCQRIFPIDTFYIGLYDAATDTVSFPFMQKDGERRALPPRCLRAEPGLLEPVIHGRQTVYLPDAAHSPLLMVRQPGVVSQSIVAVPMLAEDRVIGVLSMQSQLPDVYSQEQIEMFERLAAQVAIAIQNSHLYDAVSRGLEATLTALSRTAERRDPYTAGHQARVTDLALAIARKLDYGQDACSTLRTAGMLHDIGKLGVPAEILSKPTALSKIEFELIRTHPQSAYEILADIPFPGRVAEIVLQHHERHDGSGYPRSMSGDNILPEARILAVADVVEAMASHRPYRPARGMKAALDEIRAGRGTRYDPQVADACVALIESGEFSFQPASAG
jgi:PAS domain S-box-containing protein/putative nucleotidyltransferase with HDIG domain